MIAPCAAPTTVDEISTTKRAPHALAVVWRLRWSFAVCKKLLFVEEKYSTKKESHEIRRTHGGVGVE